MAAVSWVALRSGACRAAAAIVRNVGRTSPTSAAAARRPPDRHAMFGQPFKDDAGMESSSLDGRKELVLRRVQQIPAQRDSAELGVYKHCAVAVVPRQAQQPGLAGAALLQTP